MEFALDRGAISPSLFGLLVLLLTCVMFVTMVPLLMDGRKKTRSTGQNISNRCVPGRSKWQLVSFWVTRSLVAMMFFNLIVGLLVTRDHVPLMIRLLGIAMNFCWTGYYTSRLRRLQEA